MGLHEGILGSPGRAETLALAWPDEAACAATAQALAAAPALRQSHIDLHGNLGAGKTTFTRHLLRALGVQGRIKSPSYTIVEPYELPAAAGSGQVGAACHFDFYRFTDPREWEDAGLRELFAQPGLKLVEWPRQAQGLLPEADLELHLQASALGPRQVQAQAHSALGRQLLDTLRPLAQPPTTPTP